MPSIKDVAREASVSPATVSLVLNDKGNIPPATRERVLETVRRLGYVRNSRASNLRNDQSRIIGYAQRADRSGLNPLMDSFLHELVREIETTNRRILLFLSQERRGVDVYRELYASKRVDGFVLSYTEKDDPRFDYLYMAEVPFVAFGRSLSDLDAVTCWADVDGHAGLYQATQHLIAQGHERIALIGWPTGSASGDSRIQGWYDALCEHGLMPDEGWLVQTLDGVEMGYRATEQLLAHDRPPTAIACCSDTLALGALQVVRQAGMPVAVTGFDDTPIAAFIGLTSIRQPVKRVASVLVKMLLAQLEDDDLDQRQYLMEPELVVRETSLFLNG